MTWMRLVRAELRKLASTKMPWVFLAVLAIISAITAAAVIFGTDADGSKNFVSTAAVLEVEEVIKAHGVVQLAVGERASHQRHVDPALSEARLGVFGQLHVLHSQILHERENDSGFEIEVCRRQCLLGERNPWPNP